MGLVAYELVSLRRPADAMSYDHETLERAHAERVDYSPSERTGRIVTNSPVLDQPDEAFRGLVV